MKKNSEKYDFTPPTSLKEAKTRLNEITTGILNVEKQLGDKRRAKSLPVADYESWREKTKSARIFMIAEQRFIKDWILDRRRRLLGKTCEVWPDSDPRTMLRRAVAEGRKYVRGEENNLVEVLDAIDLYLNHDA